MITKTIISKQPNGQISITSYDDRDDLNEIIQKHITASGLTLIEVVDGIIEKPSENRDCWDYKNGKIEVDPIKFESKQDLKSQKLAERDAVFSKLKITKEEFDKLNLKAIE